MRYEYISLLKASEKGDILLVRDDNETLYVQRYREIDRQLLKKLREIECPYTMKTLGFDEDENGFFTIEEYIDGTPTNEMHFTEEQAVQALTELCEALKALHRGGIVHRDIKPANIILGEDGHIRLIDFDTARLMKEYQSRDTGYLGTIGYAPPEQYGFMQTDARSDIYAFGMTMEELLGEAAAKPKFQQVIRKCTAFDPEKRYSDISLVERALKRRFPFATVAVTVCIAAVLTAAGAFLLSDSKELQEHASHGAVSEATHTIEATPDTAAPNDETQESTKVIPAPAPDSTQTALPRTVRPTDTSESVAVETAEASAVLGENKMTFETLQNENGKNYDSYEYVFYDDPALHGSWVLCGFTRAIPEGDINFPDTLEGYSPKYITVLPDGELKTYNAGLRELNSFRWTNGYCIDDSTDIHKVEQMFVLTNSDGTQHLVYERKPMGNGDDTMPHIYFFYNKI